MIGTVRYASINTQIGIEQSRRDDVEAVGYVLVYLALGRLPWQRAGKEKGKGHLAKVLEKKLITPPEILCKKLPKQFAFIFQYIRKLKFEERPDYNMMKCLLADLLLSKMNLTKTSSFSFDWFKDINKLEITENESELKNNNSSNKSEKNNDNKEREIVKANYDKIPGNHPRIGVENEDIKNTKLESKKMKEKGENDSSDEIDDEEYDEDEDSSEKKKKLMKKEKEKINQKNSENFVKFANFKDDEDLNNVLSDNEEKKNEQKNIIFKEEDSPVKKEKEKGSSGSFGLIKSDSVKK